MSGLPRGLNINIVRYCIYSISIQYTLALLSQYYISIAQLSVCIQYTFTGILHIIDIRDRQPVYLHLLRYDRLLLVQIIQDQHLLTQVASSSIFRFLIYISSIMIGYYQFRLFTALGICFSLFCLTFSHPNVKHFFSSLIFETSVLCCLVLR